MASGCFAPSPVKREIQHLNVPKPKKNLAGFAGQTRDPTSECPKTQNFLAGFAGQTRDPTSERPKNQNFLAGSAGPMLSMRLTLLSMPLTLLSLGRPNALPGLLLSMPLDLLSLESELLQKSLHGTLHADSFSPRQCSRVSVESCSPREVLRSTN